MKVELIRPAPSLRDIVLTEKFCVNLCVLLCSSGHINSERSKPFVFFHECRFLSNLSKQSAPQIFIVVDNKEKCLIAK